MQEEESSKNELIPKRPKIGIFGLRKRVYLSAKVSDPSEVGASDQWQIDLLVIQGSQADLRVLDNVMLLCTSNSLVQNIIFSIFFRKLLIAY